jgi:hypothetical protein
MGTAPSGAQTPNAPREKVEAQVLSAKKERRRRKEQSQWKSVQATSIDVSKPGSGWEEKKSLFPPHERSIEHHTLNRKTNGTAGLTYCVHQPCLPCHVAISIWPFALPTASTPLPFAAQLKKNKKKTTTTTKATKKESKGKLTSAKYRARTTQREKNARKKICRVPASRSDR